MGLIYFKRVVGNGLWAIKWFWLKSDKEEKEGNEQSYCLLDSRGRGDKKKEKKSFLLHGKRKPQKGGISAGKQLMN